MHTAMDESNDSQFSDGDLTPDERARILLPLVYKQLRAYAQELLNAGQQRLTLTATEIVNEAWCKLSKPRRKPWANRAHFLEAAREAVDQTLKDYVKRRNRIKRGGGRARVDIENVTEILATHDGKNLDLIALNEAIRRLEERDPREAKVVELRFYFGFTDEETAKTLSVSVSTVKNDWRHALCWLTSQLCGGDRK